MILQWVLQFALYYSNIHHSSSYAMVSLDVQAQVSPMLHHYWVDGILQCHLQYLAVHALCFHYYMSPGVLCRHFAADAASSQFCSDDCPDVLRCGSCYVLQHVVLTWCMHHPTCQALALAKPLPAAAQTQCGAACWLCPHQFGVYSENWLFHGLPLPSLFPPMQDNFFPPLNFWMVVVFFKRKKIFASVFIPSPDFNIVLLGHFAIIPIGGCFCMVYFFSHTLSFFLSCLSFVTFIYVVKYIPSCSTVNITSVSSVGSLFNLKIYFAQKGNLHWATTRQYGALDFLLFGFLILFPLKTRAAFIGLLKLLFKHICVGTFKSQLFIFWRLGFNISFTFRQNNVEHVWDISAAVIPFGWSRT